jgi:biopolymer transport protein ExbB
VNTWVYETIEYLQRGGWVMIPLLVCSLAMWSLILGRVRAFHDLSAKDLAVSEGLNAIAGGLWTVRDGLRSRLLQQFLAERSGNAQLDRSILHQLMYTKRRELWNHLAMIAVLAAVVPLLGLLGTVLGMIETFQVIAVFGTGNAKAMAGGISVALITTQTGLIIAIPGMLASALLQRRARRLETGLNEFAHALDRHLKNRALPMEAAS